MYGAYARYGASALFGALIAAVLQTILQPFLDILEPDAAGTPYYNGLTVVSDHALLVILIGCVFGVITAAIIERQYAGGAY